MVVLRIVIQSSLQSLSAEFKIHLLILSNSHQNNTNLLRNTGQQRKTLHEKCDYGD